ncbi:O-antigen ligase family protein [Bacillus pinisoli]|uniref:O-antigen ligase family protein n=1 Tax=Bacillus pinisoli TaxID=2901866 RepID=UPI001FF1BA2A|nr:O-antigen ligase family protein [Bacillus pinisoli]
MKQTSLLGYLTRLFSFEAVFILFLFAGLYKGDPIISSIIPLDLTLFFFGLSSIYCLYILGLERRWLIDVHAAGTNGIYILFVGYILTSLLWSPSQWYASEKVLYMSSTVLLSLFATSVIISSSQVRVKQFLQLTFLLSLWFSVQVVIQYLQSDREGFVNVMGSSYLGTGQLIGLGAVICSGYMLFYTRSIVSKFLSFFMYIYMLSSLLVLGGRGPLIGTILTLLVPLFYSISIKRHHIKLRVYALTSLVIITVIISTIVFLLMTNQNLLTLTRLMSFFEGEDVTSAGVRSSYYWNSITYWMQQPIFGHGIGSWPILHDGADIRNYPHNIFLETAAELGLIGLILLLSLLIHSMKNLFNIRVVNNSKLNLIIVMMFISSFFNVLVSGDLPDNRLFFAILGLLCFLNRKAV